ncbi:MAG: fibronectin type III domain-containing protein, partial [Candidatus Levyibacteriota bacterium]
MKSAFWDRRIPTLIGIVLIVIGIGATTFLAKTGLKYFGFAAPTENPQDVRITNVSDTSFTLTYKTDASVIGTISVGKDKDALQTVFDDRDQQSGIPKPYILHSLTVKNLSPKTAYVFSITSGTTTYLNNNNYFQATTGPAISDSPPNAAPLAGKAIEADGTTPTEALIFATTTNGQTISTLVKQSGLYILPLNSMRTADFSSYIPLGANDNLQLLLEDDTNTSHVTVAVSDTNPVPTITIGNDYDFTLTQQPIASTSAQNQFPSFSLDTTIKLTPQITTPQKDESFTDQQPLFKGNALPNQKVTITIHSDTAVNTTVTADSNGNWSYRPT